MEITKIEKQKSNQERFNIFIDGEFAFALDIDLVIEHGLFNGMDVTAEWMEQVKREDNYKYCFRTGLNYVSKNWRTVEEVRQKLGRKGFDPDFIEQTIERLLDLGLLPNDDAYAEGFASNYARNKLQSKRTIAHKLMRKGINKKSIQKALETIDDRETIRRLAEKQAVRYKDMHPARARQKLYQFLIGKGFLTGDVGDAVDRYFPESNVYEIEFRDSEEHYTEAVALANKRKNMYRNQPLHQAKHKVYQYLVSQGYAPDMAQSVIQQIKFDNPEKIEKKKPVLKEKERKEYTYADALSLARKRLKLLTNIPPIKAKQRMYRFLASNGVPYEIIRDVMNDVFSDCGEEWEDA